MVDIVVWITGIHSVRIRLRHCTFKYRQCYVAKTRFVSPEAPMNVRGKDVGCLCMGISNVVAEGDYDRRGKWLQQHFVQK